MKKYKYIIILTITFFLIIFCVVLKPNNDKKMSELTVNEFLSDPVNSYNKYKNKYIKLTGKISKINGTSSIELRNWMDANNNLNGHVQFNENASVILKLKGIDTSRHKIYDYISIIGLVSSINDNNITIKNVNILDDIFYINYNISVLENSNKDLIKYTDNYYTLGIDNVFINYDVDSYELKYLLNDKKIKINDILNGSKLVMENNYKYFILEKFSLLECNKDINVIINKNILVNTMLCDEINSYKDENIRYN